MKYGEGAQVDDAARAEDVIKNIWKDVAQGEEFIDEEALCK